MKKSEKKYWLAPLIGGVEPNLRGMAPKKKLWTWTQLVQPLPGYSGGSLGPPKGPQEEPRQGAWWLCGGKDPMHAPCAMRINRLMASRRTAHVRNAIGFGIVNRTVIRIKTATILAKPTTNRAAWISERLSMTKRFFWSNGFQNLFQRNEVSGKLSAG